MVKLNYHFDKLESLLNEKYEKHRDPWGLEPKRALSDIKIIFPFYKHYFNVKLHGKENVADKAYMVVSPTTPAKSLLMAYLFAQLLLLN